MTVRLRDIAESEGTTPRALALAEALDIPSQPGASASLREVLRVGSVPRFRPERWNDELGVQLTNNCYNFGTDVLNGTFGRPGFASGVTDEANPPLNCPLATAGAIGDGLISTGAEPSLADVEFGHVTALVIAPGRDFHWYRRGRDGMWSHKPGGTAATNLDTSGRVITDPRTADRRAINLRFEYTDFCGFFCVPRGDVTIDGPDRLRRTSAATVVRLLVFSGMPDPEWEVDADEEAVLVAKLNAARRSARLTAAAAERPSRLGYSGFVIDRPGATPGTRDVTIVHAGVVDEVRLTAAGGPRADADGLEDELLEQARRRGFGSLL
ncbi:MAG: hypothetical protein ABW219_07715 [Ilumatobacteraceae bacterium]